MVYWYDGKLISSDRIQFELTDPGLLYGANVFSTMRVQQQSLEHCGTAWQAHQNRLRKSIAEFDWQQPNWHRLRQGAQMLAQYFPVLRLTIFNDGREWITGRNLPENLPQRQREGIIAWLATSDIFQRNLAAHKTGNYLGAYLARSQALKLGAAEAILSDRQEHWLETATGNLWGRKQDCWYTPALNHNILPGIERSRLLAYFQNNNLPVAENIWTGEFVQSLDYIYYSNCVVKLVPIKAILVAEVRFTYEVDYLPHVLTDC